MGCICVDIYIQQGTHFCSVSNKLLAMAAICQIRHDIVLYCLNPHKTQFIWLGTRQQLAKLDMVALTSAFPHFTFSSTVRDLGVTLDQELTLASHIHSLCRAFVSRTLYGALLNRD